MSTTNNILMRNGVALWLINHSSLSFQQIANFCNLHPLEVEALQDKSKKIQECNPIISLILTKEEIERCEKDHSLSIKKLDTSEYSKKRNTKDIELYNSIFWMLNETELSCKEIAKFFKCTLALVESIKDKSIKNYEELISINPVTSRVCRADELDILLNKKSLSK